MVVIVTSYLEASQVRFSYALCMNEFDFDAQG